MQASFRLVVSDVVVDDPPPDAPRRGADPVPGHRHARRRPVSRAPTRPSDEVGTIKMSWEPPDDDGGAPILYYVVTEETEGRPRSGATPTSASSASSRPAATTASACRRSTASAPSECSDLSRTARADTEPGRVAEHPDGRSRRRHDHHRVGQAADQDLAGSSTTPITWAGGRRVVPGDETRFTVHRPQQQREVRLHDQGAEPGRLLRCPGPRPRCSRSARRRRRRRPAVTDLESGANQTDLRIAWQAVLPEGPGPTVYTVSYTNGVTSGAVPGCQKLASLTCTHAGVPYDGLDLHLPRRGRQPARRPAGNRSQPSAGTAIEAVGRPAAVGRLLGGRHGQQPGGPAPVHRAGLARHDEQGRDPGRRAGRSGPSTSRPAPTPPASRCPSNEQALPGPAAGVQREGAGRLHAQRAAERADLRSRSTAMLSDIGPPVVNGKTMTWTITGTSNGDPAPARDPASTAAPSRSSRPGRSGRVQRQTTSRPRPELRRRTSPAQVWLRDDARPAAARPVRRRTDATGDRRRPAHRALHAASRAATTATPSRQQLLARGNGTATPCERRTCGFVAFSVSGFHRRLHAARSPAPAGRATFGQRPTRPTTDGGSATPPSTGWYAPR